MSRTAYLINLTEFRDDVAKVTNQSLLVQMINQMIRDTSPSAPAMLAILTTRYEELTK